MPQKRISIPFPFFFEEPNHHPPGVPHFTAGQAAGSSDGLFQLRPTVVDVWEQVIERVRPCVKIHQSRPRRQLPPLGKQLPHLVTLSFCVRAYGSSSEGRLVLNHDLQALWRLFLAATQPRPRRGP